MATWHTPKTWLTGDVLTASDMNEQIRDNLDYLKSKAIGHCQMEEATNYSTTSTTLVDIDPDKLSLTLETNGGDVLLGFCGVFTNQGGNDFYLEIAMDNTPVSGHDGVFVAGTTARGRTSSFVWLVTDVSAGSRTFKLQWRTRANTLFLAAGNPVYPNISFLSQFWAKEL